MAGGYNINLAPPPNDDGDFGARGALHGRGTPFCACVCVCTSLCPRVYVGTRFPRVQSQSRFHHDDGSRQSLSAVRMTSVTGKRSRRSLSVDCCNAAGGDGHQAELDERYLSSVERYGRCALILRGALVRMRRKCCVKWLERRTRGEREREEERRGEEWSAVEW